MDDDHANRLGRAVTLVAVVLGFAVIVVLLVFGRDPQWGVWRY